MGTNIRLALLLVIVGCVVTIALARPEKDDKPRDGKSNNVQKSEPTTPSSSESKDLDAKKKEGGKGGKSNPVHRIIRIIRRTITGKNKTEKKNDDDDDDDDDDDKKSILDKIEPYMPVAIGLCFFILLPLLPVLLPALPFIIVLLLPVFQFLDNADGISL